jgi:ADP-glucose pyrophosphorylase
MTSVTKKVLGVILVGGECSRLYPLIQQRVNVAVFFDRKYRLINFALNNFTNSNLFHLCFNPAQVPVVRTITFSYSLIS